MNEELEKLLKTKPFGNEIIELVTRIENEYKEISSNKILSSDKIIETGKLVKTKNALLDSIKPNKDTIDYKKVIENLKLILEYLKEISGKKEKEEEKEAATILSSLSSMFFGKSSDGKRRRKSKKKTILKRKYNSF